MTQEALAEQIHYSVETVRKLERDARRPSRQIAQALAEALKIDVDEYARFVAFACYGGRDDRRSSTPMPLPDHAVSPLPAPPTSLVGRAHNVTAVKAMLRVPEVRLLTLTGPPGIGKTRLALQAATELQTTFADGVHLVVLAPISDPQLVLSTIVQTLGVKETADQGALAIVKSYFQARQSLLVLDNFEQALAAAPLVAELLEVAPRLKMLVTSRVALHLYGEHEYVVPPLALPDLQTLPSVEQLTEYAATRLFVERVQAVNRSFTLTAENAGAVAEICAYLDGLPLAIELAAGRSKLFTPQALLARLNRRLELLTGGPLNLPARQQTLRNAIGWSYDLLPAEEQALFRQLGTFVGGCTLEAISALWQPPEHATIHLLDSLQSLLGKSLLQQAATGDGEPRFIMLETIREYALEQLAAANETATLQRRHAAYFVAMAERAAPELRGAHQLVWLEQLEREYTNFRTVLSWGKSHQPDIGLQLAGALWRFWHLRGYTHEGYEWLQTLLAAGANAPAPLRANALHAAGILAWDAGQLEQSSVLLDESLALYRSTDDQQATGDVLNSLGLTLQCQGDYERAIALFEESLAMFRALGSQRDIAMALNDLGEAARCQGDYTLARRQYEESLELARSLGITRIIALALHNLGCVVHQAGDAPQALRFLGKVCISFSR